MPPDIPGRHPRLHVWIARLGTAAIAGGAVAGSSVHLYVMADAAGMTAPWAPPLGLDAVALVAGVVRRLRPEDALARRALAITVLLSTVLQVMDSLMGQTADTPAVPPMDTPVGAVIVGAVMTAIPPLAGWLAFELFLRVTDDNPTDDTVDNPQVTVDVAPVSPAPVPDVDTGPSAPSPVVHAPSATMTPMTAPPDIPERRPTRATPSARPDTATPPASGRPDGTAPTRTVNRALILDAIACIHEDGDAVTNKTVAALAGVTPRTITRWRKDPAVEAAFRDPDSIVNGVHALDRPGTLRLTRSPEDADGAPQAVSTPDLVGSSSSAGGVS